MIQPPALRHAVRSPLLASLALLVGLASQVFGQVPAPGGEPAWRLGIPAADPPALHHQLEALGYDVPHGAPGPHDEVTVFASLADRAALEAAGLHVVPHEAAMPLAWKLSGGGRLPVGYSDLPTIEASLAATAAAYPGIAQLVDLSATYGPGPTYEGRSILALKISDSVASEEDEPALLFVSCHHAREIITPEIALDLIAWLTMGYGSDPQATAWVDQNEIWIVPVLNPDGYTHVWNVNNMWRKNRKPVGSGQFGVDLNRNYPFGWDAGCGGATNPASETYRGPSAASEEEVQTLMGLALAQRFAKVIDFHSAGEEVRRGYPCSPQDPALAAYVHAEATTLATAMGYSPVPSCCEGGHFNWEVQGLTNYAFLFETGTSFQPTHATALAVVATVRGGIATALDHPIPVTGRVTDAVTGLPLLASLSIAELNWQAGESRLTDGATGRYNLFLPAGTWTVQVSAQGYGPASVSVPVIAGLSTTADIALSPAPTTFGLSLVTSGGGTGDLHLQLLNVPPWTGEGWFLLSFETGAPAGSGPLAGLWPDVWTWSSLAASVLSGGEYEQASWPTAPSLFPAAPFDLPPSSLPFPAGLALDGLGVAVSPGAATYALTGVVRITF